MAVVVLVGAVAAVPAGVVTVLRLLRKVADGVPAVVVLLAVAASLAI